MQLQRERSHKTLRWRRKPLHINCGERWKSEYKGIRPALGGMIGGSLPTHVAHIGAAVVSGVRVHDGDDEVFSVFAAADEGKNTVVGVVGVNPFETVPVKLDLMEGGFGGIEMIEIADEPLDAAMG